jgi:eukaryotic-like serine/threonine-protein kinase
LSSNDSSRNQGSRSKPERKWRHANTERLAQALISRGLVAPEEIECFSLSDDEGGGPETILKLLVKSGALTPNQARRAGLELSNLLNQQIPGYQLLERLGKGSMGTVYKARQLSMNRLVALKILHSRYTSKTELLQRLTREAHLAAKLSHNNIVQAIDVGFTGTLHYFVMEYVEGTAIRQELEKRKIYEELEALEVVVQIAQALQHAHRRGLIHRDVKPANIILTSDGVAKLADLGMACEASDDDAARAERGMTVGTPFYMAPEQINGGADVDGRADIYSLGATLYHMVTGQPPFPGKRIDEVLNAHLKQELVPPDHLNTSLSSGLGEVVEFMMTKQVERRYQTPEDLILDLECLLNRKPPKLARDRIASGTLAALAQGATEAADADPEQEGPKQLPWIWFAVSIALLVISLLLNLILVLLHR